MSTTPNEAPAMAKPSIALIHHVFFWLNNPESESDKNALIAGLNSLRAIPTIQRMHVGVLASTEKRDVVDTSWDVSEIMFFMTLLGKKSIKIILYIWNLLKTVHTFGKKYWFMMPRMCNDHISIECLLATPQMLV